MHRDISVRNILSGVGNKAKLGDFGMARRMVAGQDFWKIDRPGRPPIRYMSPESFVTSTFTEKSDVWSFGVMMWEVMM